MAKKEKRAPNGLRTGLRFEKLLVNAEQSLRLELDKARLESDHSLSIGEQAEAAVRDMLRSHLPAGYSVGHGHVYDAYGDRSRQTDVVTANPEHPLTFPEERSGTYLVDGVSAAGEVKATLTPQKLEDCLAKGTRFKELRMTRNQTDVVATERHRALIRQIGLVPPYFVLAFANKMKVDTVHERLQGAGLTSPPPGKADDPKDDGHAPQPPLDAVCVLGQGVFVYLRPNNPIGIRVKFGKEIEEAADLAGWIFMPTDAPLAWTLTWLHSSMPRIMRGGSVFSPYLIPNQKNLRYMASRGYINVNVASGEETEALPAEEHP